MAQFLTGNKLNSEIESILDKAQKQLILISPYIKLHERYICALKEKKADPELKIIVVFGKNEEDPSKSMKIDDLNFFMDFPNIEIKYEKRLHAKYYANEESALITSMNLYSYSQDNNIEAGVVTKSSLIDSLTAHILTPFTGGDKLDEEAYSYFCKVINNALTIYHKTPVFENSFMGLKKKYTGSKILQNNVNNLFIENSKPIEKSKFNFPIVHNKLNYKENQTQRGYCIRTGQSIQFNPKKPFSDESYNSWVKFKNEEYPEKYCHFSGEISNGETCYSKPILKKNWKKAKELFSLT